MNANLKIKDCKTLSIVLDAISLINNSCILNVSPTNLTSLVSSPDNTLLLYSEYGDIESSYEGKLNLPDIKKLARVIDNISESSPTLLVERNNIQYKDSQIKFKYHLFDDGFLTNPRVNLEKIKQFECDANFTLTKQQITKLIKNSSFTSNVNKVYLYTENGFLYGEITDKAKHNTDAICLNLGSAEYNLNPIALVLDNIKLISFIDDNVSVKVNTKFGVVVVDIVKNSIKLKYIITSLTQ